MAKQDVSLPGPLLGCNLLELIDLEAGAGVGGGNCGVFFFLSFSFSFLFESLRWADVEQLLICRELGRPG